MALMRTGLPDSTADKSLVSIIVLPFTTDTLTFIALTRVAYIRQIYRSMATGATPRTPLKIRSVLELRKSLAIINRTPYESRLKKQSIG